MNQRRCGALSDITGTALRQASVAESGRAPACIEGADMSPPDPYGHRPPTRAQVLKIVGASFVITTLFYCVIIGTIWALAGPPPKF